MFKARKELGQNFLTNAQITAQMVDYLTPTQGDTVVEIGPGLGALTNLIADKVQRLYAIELDNRFIEYLNDTIKNPSLTIVNQNILDWLPDFTPPQNFKIIGSLPYYITSPILHTVIKMKELPEICVFLIQKEVAEKISAKEPENSYLSVFTQTFCDVEFMQIVSRKEFDPVPAVDGGIIKLTKKVQDTEIDKHKYEKFLHHAFKSPRKMLNKVFTKEELEIIKIEGSLRPQNLSVEDFIQSYKRLRSKIQRD